MSTPGTDTTGGGGAGGDTTTPTGPSSTPTTASTPSAPPQTTTTPPPQTSTTPSPTSQTPTPSTSKTTPLSSSTSTPPSSSSSSSRVESTSSSTPSITVVTQTSTRPGESSTSSSSSSAAAATSGAAGLASPSTSSGSSPDPKVIAVATVVPIVVVVLAILAGIWLWRKRRDRRNNEEMRRKEMEEYGFNPNNDPSLPPVGSVVEEESAAGYRGWGTTSTARKASTNMSSQPAMARSDSGGHGMNGHPSPPVGGPRYSDGNSGDPLVRNNTDNLAVMGAVPAATGKRGAAMARGPSNASSTYSAGNYSDVSALSDGPLPNDGPQDYGAFVHPDEGGRQNGDSWGGQPVIRDVSARRNTQIENPAVSPHQGSAGISQNF